jgi:hypothetical protein
LPLGETLALADEEARDTFGAETSGGVIAVQT